MGKKKDKKKKAEKKLLKKIDAAGNNVNSLSEKMEDLKDQFPDLQDEPNDDTVLGKEDCARAPETESQPKVSITPLRTQLAVGVIRPKNKKIRLVLELHVEGRRDEVISRLELKIRGRDANDVEEFHSEIGRYGDN